MLIPLGAVYSDRGARRRRGRLRPVHHRPRLRGGRRGGRRGRASSGGCRRSGCSPAACCWPGWPAVRRGQRRHRSAWPPLLGRADGRGRRARSTWSGFVLLQEEVSDDLRGRVFSSLNTLVRLCVLRVDGGRAAAGRAARAGCPRSLAGRLDRRRRRRTSALPGVRLTLWLAGADHHRRRRAGAALGAGRSAVAGLSRPGTHPSPAAGCPAVDGPDLAERRRVSRPAATPSTPARRFIAFEGGEGCGKSTQARRLAAAPRRGADPRAGRHRGRARSCGRSCSTRRPTGSSPRAEALLMAADRAQHVAEVVGPGAGRRPPRRDRPLRRVVDRLPGLRPRARPPTRCAGCREWATDGRLARPGGAARRRPVPSPPTRLGRDLDRFEQEGDGLPRAGWPPGSGRWPPPIPTAGWWSTAAGSVDEVADGRARGGGRAATTRDV